MRKTDRGTRRLGGCGWVAAVAASLAVQAHAQVLSHETFDEPSTCLWELNGAQILLDDGRGIQGGYIHLPFLDFFGVTLSTDQTSTGLIGDLSGRTQPTRVTFDAVTFAFQSFDGNDIDPSSRPLTLQLIDSGDPMDFTDDVSVWVLGDPIPTQRAGWRSYEFTIPPAQATLPTGWGGTGDEDPVTFEPRLPPGRTYASVLASVDRVQITTFQPGFFYGFSFWEMGFDNARVEVGVSPCPCDFNGGGLAVNDIFDFLNAWFAGDPRADFNGGGLGVNDIFDFLNCWFGSCV